MADLTAPASRKRTRLTPEARREQILDRSAELVLQSGLTAVTMERVASLMGISKGLVYNYFPSRDALLGALLHRAQTELRARGLASAMQAVRFEDLIRDTTRLYLEQTRDRGALINALLSDPSVAKLMEADNRAHREQSFRFFVRAVRREYGLALPVAVAGVEMLMSVTGQAGRLVARGQLDTVSATSMCVQLITGGLEKLARDPQSREQT